MLWRAEILVGDWSAEAAAHAKANDVTASALESDAEIVVTCTWETEPDLGIGAAMFELTERLRPHHEVSMSDFGSMELLAD